LSEYAASLGPLPAPFDVVCEGVPYALDERRIADALATAPSGRSYHAARPGSSEQVHDLLTDAVVERNEQMLSQMEEGLEDLLATFDARLASADDRGVGDGLSGVEADGVLSEADIERLRDRISSDDALAARLAQW